MTLRRLAIAALILSPAPALAQTVKPFVPDGAHPLPPPGNLLTPWSIIQEANILLQGVMVAIVVALIAAIVVFVRGRRDPGQTRQRLSMISRIAGLLAAFGPMYGLMNSFIGVANTSATNIAVIAPGVAEALFVGSLGVMAALVAAVLSLFVQAGPSEGSAVEAGLATA